jgi:4-hydroxybenzoate polyprenyltransferase
MAKLCVLTAVGILLTAIGFSAKREDFDFIVMFFLGAAFTLLIWMAL